MNVPVPARLADRPTLGGLAVPYVSVSDGTRHLLGQVHRSKALRCIRDHLCQACGKPLRGRRIVFVTAEGLASSYSAEAALDPKCAAYAARVCPMLAGEMDTYRQTAAPVERVACVEPGCGCGGFVPSPGVNSRPDGAPAEEWWAVWLDDYQIAVDDRMQIHGLAWLGMTPVRVRELARGVPRTLWQK